MTDLEKLDTLLSLQLYGIYKLDICLRRLVTMTDGELDEEEIRRDELSEFLRSNGLSFGMTYEAAYPFRTKHNPASPAERMKTFLDVNIGEIYQLHNNGIVYVGDLVEADLSKLLCGEVCLRKKYVQRLGKFLERNGLHFNMLPSETRGWSRPTIAR